ncbi:MAG: Methyltransferase family protein [Parcubacteria group bacterium GW2011_GWD2_38_11]|nr:MAG: Methyltransferase family protein [Parcubacteria group bacterium GW2011_GWD2_38_11]
MEKILVCIPSYGSGQVEYLKTILREYNSMHFDIDVAVFLTDDINLSEFDNIRIKKFRFDPSIGLMLPHQHKEYMAENVDKYDLFIYSENDILITERNIRYFLQYSQKLKGTPFIPGFVRFELKNDDYVYLIDFHSGNCTLRHGPFWMRFYALKHYLIKNKIIEYKLVLDGETYFEPNNLHQASYLLTSDQFRAVLSSGNYFLGPDGGFGAVLESAASDVYFRCNLTKLVNLDHIEDSLIHHLPNKYVNTFSQYNKTEVPDTGKLKFVVEKAKIKSL